MQGQIDIFNFLDPKDVEKNQEPKQETKVKPICQYSKHTCNKEVLHALASEENPFCPKVCCRFCNTSLCGVRCNGSSEPKKKSKALTFSEYKEHCRHNGWTKGATETEPATVMCSYNNRENAKCWDDWIPCNESNCPLFSKGEGND